MSSITHSKRNPIANTTKIHLEKVYKQMCFRSIGGWRRRRHLLPLSSWSLCQTMDTKTIWEKTETLNRSRAWDVVWRQGAKQNVVGVRMYMITFRNVFCWMEKLLADEPIIFSTIGKYEERVYVFVCGAFPAMRMMPELFGETFVSYARYVYVL